jgi:hypothetical protein
LKAYFSFRSDFEVTKLASNQLLNRWGLSVSSAKHDAQLSVLSVQDQVIIDIAVERTQWVLANRDFPEIRAGEV